MRIFSSKLALKEIVALSAGGKLSLAQLGVAIKSSPSAAQKALSILVDDGIAQRYEDPPVYQLDQGKMISHLIFLAFLTELLETTAAIAGRANPAIEFMAEAEGRLTGVLSSRQPAYLISKAAAFLEELANCCDQKLRIMDHRDLRRELLPHPELREEMQQAKILYGDLDRSFPDRRQHGLTRGHPLHHFHPSLRSFPDRRLIHLAKGQGIKSLHLFGSSVRSDFRPDSDIDIMVQFHPDMKPTLGSMVELENRLGDLLDRDIDLVREESLNSDFRKRVSAEAIRLL
ncbi:MAG: nucleotidyltransferase family protein [Candidatus Dormibacteraceae bacterium]